MTPSSFIDGLGGNELAKNELKLAHRKMLNLWKKIGILGFLILTPTLYFLTREPPGSFITFPISLVIIFGTVLPFVFGAMISSFYFSYITRHITVKLPEAIAPKVEFTQ